MQEAWLVTNRGWNQLAPTRREARLYREAT
jgi:hypothetical protein